jgi:hypothetical protein
MVLRSKILLFTIILQSLKCCYLLFFLMVFDGIFPIISYLFD